YSSKNEAPPEHKTRLVPIGGTDLRLPTVRKIHRYSAGDEDARIGSFRIRDSQFSGADAALLDHAATGREDSFGEGAKSSTRGRVRSPENARRPHMAGKLCATLL